MGKHNRPRKISPNPVSRAQRGQAIQSAKSLIAQNYFDQAEEILRKDIPKSSKDPDALRLRGLIAERQNRPVQAMEFAKKSARIEAHPETHMLLAQIHSRHGDTLATISACREALVMAPENIHARLMLAATLEERNQVDEAADELAVVLENPPDSEVALRRSARINAAIQTRRKHYEDAVRIIDSQVLAQDLPPPEKRGALFLKAKALDRAGKFDDAFESARQANQISQVAFDPNMYDAQLDTFMEVWNRDMIAALPLGDPTSELPVFIAGMPRSGTSLLDRIIDAHPQGAGVGELSLIEQFWATLNAAYDPDAEPKDAYKGVAPGKWKETAKAYINRCRKISPARTRRVANKSISNDLMLGLLNRLFIKAKLIHIVRDPRDVAVSCFFGDFNTQMYPWSTRLDCIARAWSSSQRIMEHFSKVLDTPILDVRYEELVGSPDEQLPRLIAYLGLDWDPQCQRFHELDRPIRTLSYDQVNQPINTRSVARHENYARHLESVDWPS